MCAFVSAHLGLSSKHDSGQSGGGSRPEDSGNNKCRYMYTSKYILKLNIPTFPLFIASLLLVC